MNFVRRIFVVCTLQFAFILLLWKITISNIGMSPPSSMLNTTQKIIYGTAWKKEATVQHVMAAIQNGFRAIDTACQPRHYREDLVGKALRAVYQQGLTTREEIFLQTKFSPIDCQDASTIPYNPAAPLAAQVAASIQVSLSNLGTTYLDSLVLHSPLPTREETLQVWRAMEAAVANGTVRALGISNCYKIADVQWLYESSTIKPKVVQNRFYADTNWDPQIRAFCLARGISYQSFWSLTANPTIIGSDTNKRIAQQRGLTAEQAFFRFLLDLGITPLSGTTNPVHMREDVEVSQAPPLTSAEMEAMKTLLVK